MEDRANPKTRAGDLLAFVERIAEPCFRLLAARRFRWLVFASMALLTGYQALASAFFQWNDVRLARSLVLAQQGPLYSPADSGPVLGIIYGPLSYLFYLPALLFPSPGSAIPVGILLSTLIGFLPVVLLFRDRQVVLDPDPVLKHLLFYVVFFHFYGSEAVSYSLWNIHVDAPALALSCLACHLAVKHGGKRHLSLALAGSALAASATPWAKQTLAPILLAPPIYLALLGNWLACAQFAALAAVFSVVLGVCFAALYGAQNLLLSLVLVPARHSLSFGNLAFLETALEDWMDMVGVLILLSVIVLAVSLRDNRQAPSTDANPDDWAAWTVFLGAALVTLPTSLMGLLKVGGDINNLAALDYFTTLALAILFLRTAASAGFRLSGWLPKAARLALGLLLGVQLLRAAPDLVRLPVRLGQFLQGIPSEQAFRYARRHPGEAYFPWYPLATLMAEGKAYHTEWGLIDRERAGYRVGEEHLRSELPPRFRYLAFRADNQGYVSARLPDFRCRVELPELPHWTVYVRGDGLCETPRDGGPGAR